MTTYVIECSEQGCSLAVDGGEPKPMESVEMACEAIEAAEGASEQGEAPMSEDAAMQQGFAGARGGSVGMVGM